MPINFVLLGKGLAITLNIILTNLASGTILGGGGGVVSTNQWVPKWVLKDGATYQCEQKVGIKNKIVGIKQIIRVHEWPKSFTIKVHVPNNHIRRFGTAVRGQSLLQHLPALS